MCSCFSHTYNTPLQFPPRTWPLTGSQHSPTHASTLSPCRHQQKTGQLTTTFGCSTSASHDSRRLTTGKLAREYKSRRHLDTHHHAHNDTTGKKILKKNLDCAHLLLTTHRGLQNSFGSPKPTPTTVCACIYIGFMNCTNFVVLHSAKLSRLSPLCLPVGLE